MSDEWTDGEDPEIGARCLMICRQVEFDAGHPDSPYSLRGVTTFFRVRSGFPVTWRDPVWLYVEFFGEPGEYEVWVDLVRVESDEDGDEVGDVQETNFRPFVLDLTPGLFVQGRTYFLPRVPFTTAGVHEFRLHVAGVSEVLVSQRFMVEG